MKCRFHLCLCAVWSALQILKKTFHSWFAV